MSSSVLAARSSRVQNLSIVLLVVVGLVSLLLAEQVVSGWLALGERLNISRRDFNLMEWAVMIGCGLWGLFAWWTALGIARDGPASSARRFFEGEGPMTPGLRFVTVALAVTGAAGLLIFAQVLAGWLPLGVRANISRRDLNLIELGIALLALLWAGLCLRTALGVQRRERAAWSWGQWLLFLVTMLGVVILMSGISDIPDLRVPKGGFFANQTSALQFLASVIDLVAPGLIVTLSSLVAYRFATSEYGDITSQRAISGTLAERALARDVSAARVSAGQAIRIRLAASPGAGAIIGLIAVFAFFAVATEVQSATQTSLFLLPSSLASALTNNVTRGIVAIGVTMLMISGEFDLSVGSLLGIAGLTFLGLMTGQFPPGGPVTHPVIAAILTIIFVGFLGFLNGFILIRTGIHSFIVTLSTQLMLRGIPLVFIAGGHNVRWADYDPRNPPMIQISRVLIIIFVVVLTAIAFPVGRSLLRARLQVFRARRDRASDGSSDFGALGMIVSGMAFAVMALAALLGVVLAVGSILDQIGYLSQGDTLLNISFFDLMNGRIASLPFIGEIPREINLLIGVLWWILLVIIFQFILNHTRYGNATFATGGNPGAALAQGINVNRMKILNYVLVGVLVAIAGILDASRLKSIDATRGIGLELEVIAATVVGGALLTGGYGSMVGALFGVLIFGMMQTGLVLIGVDARLFEAFIGAIILVAVIINTWSRRIRT